MTTEEVNALMQNQSTGIVPPSVTDAIKGILNSMAYPNPQQYSTLEEWIDAMNKFQRNQNGGIAGAYSSYDLIKYNRGGFSMKGYSITRGSQVSGVTAVDYFSDQHKNITQYIRKIGGKLVYVDLSIILWTVFAITAAVVFVILAKKKRR